MKPFLKIFGVEELNGHSPFDVEMDIPSDLINLVKDLFPPPKRDLRGNPKNENYANPSDNNDSEEDADSNHKCDIIPGFVKNIQSLDLDTVKDRESLDSADADENNDSSNIKIEKFLMKEMGVLLFLNLKVCWDVITLYLLVFMQWN